MGQCLRIYLTEAFHRTVGIAERLEISQVVRCTAIPHLMEGDTLIKLLCNGFARSAVPRVEGCIVAIRASARSHRPVTVGAGESGIYHQLLQALPVFLAEIPGV